jgi:single-strand DNA-binding protein
LNRLSLTARLTKDPELRHTPSGMAVCSMRVAWTTSRKSAESGSWEDKSNFIDATVWGAQGESCATYLAKGSRIAIDGRLEWREWQADDGSKRQAYEVVCEAVIFLDKKGDGPGGAANAAAAAEHDQFVPAGAGVSSSDFAPTTAAEPDDDIPFAFLDMAPLDGVVWARERFTWPEAKLRLR